MLCLCLLPYAGGRTAEHDPLHVYHHHCKKMRKSQPRLCPCGGARIPRSRLRHLGSDRRVRWMTVTCSGDTVRTGGTLRPRSSACSRRWLWSSSPSRLCQQKEGNLLRLTPDGVYMMMKEGKLALFNTWCHNTATGNLCDERPTSSIPLPKVFLSNNNHHHCKFGWWKNNIDCWWMGVGGGGM